MESLQVDVDPDSTAPMVASHGPEQAFAIVGVSAPPFGIRMGSRFIRVGIPKGKTVGTIDVFVPMGLLRSVVGLLGERLNG